MLNLARAATYLAAALVVAACTSGSPSAPQSSPSGAISPPSSSPPVASAVARSAPASLAPSASTGPTGFTSTTYGYSLALPGGWKAVQATAPWNGKGAPFHDVPEADQFVGPAVASAWLFAAPTTRDLAGQATEAIAANYADHGDQCPAVPDVNDPIEIGGEPGVLLGWNCGILIYQAITVHKGIAYVFGFRDPTVHAATDPADRAIFLDLLESVTYPD